MRAEFHEKRKIEQQVPINNFHALVMWAWFANIFNWAIGYNGNLHLVVTITILTIVLLSLCYLNIKYGRFYAFDKGNETDDE